VPNASIEYRSASERRHVPSASRGSGLELARARPEDARLAKHRSDWHAQSARDLEQRADENVASALLDVTVLRDVHRDARSELPLRQAALSTKLRDAGADVVYQTLQVVIDADNHRSKIHRDATSADAVACRAPLRSPARPAQSLAPALDRVNHKRKRARPGVSVARVCSSGVGREALLGVAPFVFAGGSAARAT